ncbi:MAG: multidrug ABC transporter [Lachnospiraceae bacterium]|nr:multidrug ABC transporter [Lachnospiraceae bacterium]
MWKYALILVTGTFISSISQVLLKKAAMKKYDNILREYLNAPVIFAYTLFFVSTMASVLAYKGLPISMGPVLEGTAYIFVTFFGVTIFHEKINPMRIVSLALILLGITIYALWA